MTKNIQDLVNFMKNPLYSGVIKSVVNTIYVAGVDVETDKILSISNGIYKLSITKDNNEVILSIKKI